MCKGFLARRVCEIRPPGGLASTPALKHSRHFSPREVPLQAPVPQGTEEKEKGGHGHEAADELSFDLHLLEHDADSFSAGRTRRLVLDGGRSCVREVESAGVRENFKI